MSEKIVTTRRASDEEELGYARDVSRAFKAWLDSDDDSDSPIQWMMTWLEDRAREAEEKIMDNVARLSGRIPDIDEINALCAQAKYPRERDQLRYRRGLRDGKAGNPPEEAAPSYVDGYGAGRSRRR
jgi:hypothetical protein